MTQPTGPLEGIRVLDLTGVLFGPLAAQTLGDWGAEVIKVEPLTGDTWRNSGQFRNRGMSGQFMAVNRNKRSLALDLKHPARQGSAAAADPDGGCAGEQRAARGAGATGLRLRGLSEAQPATGLCGRHRLRPGRTVGRAPGL